MPHSNGIIKGNKEELIKMQEGLRRPLRDGEAPQNLQEVGSIMTPGLKYLQKYGKS